MMRGWGAEWWWIGAAFMVFCMVMMARMMGGGHSGHGGEGGQGGRGGAHGAERTLADRLARGEIDVEEYERLLEALRRTEPSRTGSSTQHRSS